MCWPAAGVLVLNDWPSPDLLAQLLKTKKAGVPCFPEGMRHAGLLINKPPGTAELFFS
jgi:hypothetical protein